MSLTERIHKAADRMCVDVGVVAKVTHGFAGDLERALWQEDQGVTRGRRRGGCVRGVSWLLCFGHTVWGGGWQRACKGIAFMKEITSWEELQEEMNAAEAAIYN